MADQEAFAVKGPARLDALGTTGLLDSAPEEAFDRLTRLAARVLNASAAAISFIGADRHFIKSEVGLPRRYAESRSVPLTHSYCKHVVQGAKSLAVTDAREHPLLRDSPAIADLAAVAYLGFPLNTPNDHTIGCLGVFDSKPRDWSEDERAALAGLAQSVTAEIAARYWRRRAERAEAAVQAREERTTEILESIDEAFYAIDREWRLVYVNHGTEEIWGRARSELLGRSMIELFPSFVGSESHRAHQQAMAKGEPVRIETVSTVLQRPVEINIYPSPSGLSVYFRDLSERYRMERELRERNEKLTLAETSAGIGVWDVDLATGKAHGTPQFFRLMGLEPTSEAVPLETFRALRHPDDRARVVEGFREAMAKGADSYEMEYRVVRPDGQTRWIFGRGRVVRDAAGKPVRYSGVDIDVTERKLAEAALAESEARLRLAQEAAGIGTWDWDIVSGVMRWSDNQWRLHGAEPGARNLTYEAWKASIHPDDRDRASAAVAEAVAAKAGYETEYRVAMPDGSVRWLAGRGTVMADQDRKPVRLLGVSVDVTERRAAAEALARLNQELERRVRERTAQLEAEGARRMDAEARLHHAQKMEAVGQLTGGIAHDFNNLLTVIMGNLDTLRRRMSAGEATAERLSRPIDMAMQGAKNASQLTQRLLAFSRRQPLEPKVLALNDLVAGMSEMIRRTLSEAIRVETALADDLWPVLVDAGQMESALLNLVVNARDAMAEGGRLTIRTANTDEHEEFEAAGERGAAGQYVMLSVIDSGTGIPPDHLDRIFEPFFTTKDIGKGSGLGLSMVYGFMKQSGGHVRVTSELGVGTVVRLYLPRAREAGVHARLFAPAQDAVQETLPRAKAGETLLLVEDNAEVRDYAVSALEYLGYRVLQAEDGRSALRIALGAQTGRIDLLFTDVILPGGMNGIQLAQKIVQNRPRLPVLFSTGYTRNEALQQDRLSVPVHLLRKPYTIDSLAAYVRELIDAASDDNVIPFKAIGGSDVG